MANELTETYNGPPLEPPVVLTPEQTENLEETAEETQTAADEILEEIKWQKEQINRLVSTTERMNQSSQAHSGLMSEIQSLRTELRNLKDRLMELLDSIPSHQSISPQEEPLPVVVVTTENPESAVPEVQTGPKKPRRRRI